jgi:ferredoxin-NADP reductase
VSGPPPAPTVWQTATVVATSDETARAKTLRLALSDPIRHEPGQHYVVRLTAPDGYTASRSYSIASAPDDTNEIELTVERLDDGEVSSFLHDGLEVGDEIEVRGPIGGWFVWDGETPALLVGGGSGVVPLMAMLRHARRTGRSDRVRLVLSVRSPDDVYYADELVGRECTVLYSRVAPAGSARPPGRIAVADIAPILADPVFERDATVFLCGSARFADGASRVLTEAGVAAERIRVERFGPTG